MAKTSITQFDPVPANNTDIGGVNIAAGWPPANVRPALENLMAYLASYANPQIITATNTTTTLTDQQSSSMVKVFTGSLTADTLVKLTTTAESLQWVSNQTNGGRSINFTGGVSVISIPPDGAYYLVRTNSTGLTALINFGNISNFTSSVISQLQPAGFDMTGKTSLIISNAIAPGAWISFSGPLTSTASVKVPAQKGIFFASNSTTGGQNIVLNTGTSSRSTVTLPSNGTLYAVVTDINGNIIQYSLAVGSIDALGTATFRTDVRVSNGTGIAPGIYGSATGYLQIGTTSAPNNWGFIGFYNNAVTAGAVNYNLGGGGVTYNTASDRRRKINDGDISAAEAWGFIRRIRAKWFRWKSHPGAASQPGFFAQQVHRWFPWAVTKPQKAADMWMMDSGTMMPMVITALQDLDRRVKALEK